MVILVFFLVISVNHRLFRYFGSYSGISVIPVILVNRRTLFYPLRVRGDQTDRTASLLIKMSARMTAPAAVFIFVIVTAGIAQASKDDRFTEELYINSLDDGHIMKHFQFTTIWNASISDQNTCRHLLGNVSKNTEA